MQRMELKYKGGIQRIGVHLKLQVRYSYRVHLCQLLKSNSTFFVWLMRLFGIGQDSVCVCVVTSWYQVQENDACAIATCRCGVISIKYIHYPIHRKKHSLLGQVCTADAWEQTGTNTGGPFRAH